MRKISITGFALLLTFTISCKKNDEAAYEGSVSAPENSKQAVETPKMMEEESKLDQDVEKNAMTSSAAKVDKNSKRKFLKTVDSKFKVKDVAESTYKIEDLASKMGGFVTKSDLRSSVLETDQNDVSMDSTLVSTKYFVENDITVRVPNVKLDTFLRSISKEVAYLDHRNIHSDDVSLQYFKHELTQKRGKKHQNRLERTINSKPGKLNDAIDAENQLASTEEEAENELLTQMNLEDEVNYSTVSLNIYQNQQVKNELVVSSGNINQYTPNIGFQIWESIIYGWYLLEGIIAVVFRIWPILLIVFFATYFWKKRRLA